MIFGDPGGIIVMILGALMIFSAVKAVKGRSIIRMLNDSTGSAYVIGVAGALAIILGGIMLFFDPFAPY